MNKTKWMSALALALLGSQAFGQPGTAAMAVKLKHEVKIAPANAGQIKVLRAGIKQDKEDMTAKLRASRAERKQLAVQQRAELEKVRGTKGTRAEKKAARKTVALKYAALMKGSRTKLQEHRRFLREDVKSKKDQIQKLRQS